MALIYHEVYIPIDTESTFDYVVIKQGDSGTHKIRATLLSNNSVYTIPTTGHTYYFKFRKPDNTYVLTQATVSNNQIIGDVTEEMLRVSGTGRGEFMICQGTNELKTATFYVKIVAETYTSDDVISSSDFSTFASLLSGAASATSNANAAAAAANAAADLAAAKAALIPNDYTDLIEDVEELQEAMENLDIETDSTLSVQGKPADAKKTGDEISALNGSLEEIPIWSDTAIGLLETILSKVAYVDSDAGTYVTQLIDELTGDTFRAFGGMKIGNVSSTPSDAPRCDLSETKRISKDGYFSLTSGDIVGFKNASDYSTYAFALAPRSGDSVNWSATGGTAGYASDDFTITVTSSYYYLIVKRIDLGVMSASDLLYINSNLGLKPASEEG